MEVTCDSRACLLDQRTIEELEDGYESGQYSWKPVAAAKKSEFWGKTLEEGLLKKLGTFRPEKPVSLDVSMR